MNLALVCGSITIEINGDIPRVIILLSQRDASTDRHMSSDNPITTKKALAEHMHRATLSIRDAASSPEQLPKDGLNGPSAHERVTMGPVCRDQLVAPGDTMFNANGNRLLTRGEMAESSDLLLLVETVSG